MATFRGPNQGSKLVWRITAEAPLGALVDPGALPPSRAVPGEPEPGGWVVSSFDLKHGVDVRDEDDTVPGDLYDALFSLPKAGPSPGDPG
ncbi:MAG: hypothetical protein V4750_07495 [Pseudomonadota bacterium]